MSENRLIGNTPDDAIQYKMGVTAVLFIVIGAKKASGVQVYESATVALPAVIERVHVKALLFKMTIFGTIALVITSALVIAAAFCSL